MSTDKAGKTPAHSTVTSFRKKLGSIRTHTYPLIDQMIEYRPKLKTGYLQGKKADKLEQAIGKISHAYRLLGEANELLVGFDPVALVKEIEKDIALYQSWPDFDRHAEHIAKLQEMRSETIKKYKLKEADLK